MTSYVTQTGVSATGQPIYSVTSTAPASVPAPAPAPVPAPAPAPAPVSCTGSLVNNSDGTRSCVVTVATCPSGYPLYKVQIWIQSTINNSQHCHRDCLFRSPTSILELWLTCRRLACRQLDKQSWPQPTKTACHWADKFERNLENWITLSSGSYLL